MTEPHEAALPIQISTLFLCSLGPYCLVLDYRVLRWYTHSYLLQYYPSFICSAPYLHAACSAPYILTDRPRNPHSHSTPHLHKTVSITKIFPRTLPTGSKTGIQASEIMATQTKTRSPKLKEYNIALLGDKSVGKKPVC
jgi:hypothetical protein